MATDSIQQQLDWARETLAHEERHQGEIPRAELEKAWAILRENDPDSGIGNVSLNTLSAMFGDYVKQVDPSKYADDAQGFWQEAMARRIMDVDPSLEGKKFIVDYGGSGTQYSGLDYGYSDMASNTPYKLDAPYALGAWVYTKDGDPQKTTASWNRNDDQNPESYGWKWVSAFDKNTMDVSAIPKELRYKVTVAGGKADEFGGYTPITYDGFHAQDPPQAEAKDYTIGGETYKPVYADNALVGFQSTTTDGYGDPRWFSPQGIAILDEKQNGNGGFVDSEGYVNPLHTGLGVYADPAGREGTQLLSAAGYLPSKGGYDYGPRNWFEGFMQRNSASIAMAVFTVATAGGAAAAASAAATAAGATAAGASSAAASAGATMGAITGAITGAATTGQKTNDPWRIVAGGAAGAASGAIPYAGQALGVAANSLGGVALNTSLAAGANAAGQYAATGKVDLEKVGISALSAGIPALTQTYAPDISRYVQNTMGLDKAAADELTKQILSAASATAMGGIRDGEAGAVSGLLGSVSKGLVDYSIGANDPLSAIPGQIVGNTVAGVTTNAMNDNSRPATPVTTTPTTTPPVDTTPAPNPTAATIGLLQTSTPHITRTGPAVTLRPAIFNPYALPDFDPYALNKTLGI